MKNNMSNNIEFGIPQEATHFSSKVSINNNIHHLPFSFPVELEKHFPHGVLDGQFGLKEITFQEQSVLGTEYESANQYVIEFEKKQSTYLVLKNELIELFGRRELKSLWEKQITEKTVKKNELENIAVSLKLKIKNIFLENSLFALILMLVAALIFISADFIISITVVSTQLLLDGEIFGDRKIFGFNPSPFIFALALAAIPFILKPAYDRLIEQPYNLNKNKNYFNILILLITLVAFGLLVNTGFVRLKDFDDSNITIVETTASGDGLKIDDNNEAQGNVMPEKPEFFTSFVVIVSGVIFAFGGAILLGIGLPDLRKRLNRSLLKTSLKINQIKIRHLEKKIEKLIELQAFYDSDEARQCQGMSLDEKWELLVKDMEKIELDLVKFKELRTEILKRFKCKIHEYGHQMATEFSEPKLKKQGLRYINQKASPRPYILLRNNISQL